MVLFLADGAPQPLHRCNHCIASFLTDGGYQPLHNFSLTELLNHCTISDRLSCSNIALFLTDAAAQTLPYLSLIDAAPQPLHSFSLTDAAAQPLHYF